MVRVESFGPKFESSRVTRVTVQISMGRVTENRSSHSLIYKSSHESSLVTNLLSCYFNQPIFLIAYYAASWSHAMGRFMLFRIHNVFQNILWYRNVVVDVVVAVCLFVFCLFVLCLFVFSFSREVPKSWRSCAYFAEKILTRAHSAEHGLKHEKI